METHCRLLSNYLSNMDGNTRRYPECQDCGQNRRKTYFFGPVAGWHRSAAHKAVTTAERTWSPGFSGIQQQILLFFYFNIYASWYSATALAKHKSELSAARAQVGCVSVSYHCALNYDPLTHPPVILCYGQLINVLIMDMSLKIYAALIWMSCDVSLRLLSSVNRLSSARRLSASQPRDAQDVNVTSCADRMTALQKTSGYI